MGAWGTGLYSDDAACDVRDAYREYVGDGLSGSQATDRLLEEWDRVHEDEPSFWLALADTQWRCGRLEERVKTRALEIIAAGSDLARWNGDTKSVRKRRAVLAKLEDRLGSSQPAPKKIRPRFRNSTDWELGELIAYTLKSGNKIIFHVVDKHTDRGGTTPICAVLGWKGQELPAFWRLKLSRARRPKAGPSQLMIASSSAGEYPASRLQRTNYSMRLLEPSGPFEITFWRLLDKELEERFGLK
jgi:hypothetical protein